MLDTMKKIKEIMRQQDVKNVDLAKLCGITEQAVSGWFSKGSISRDNFIKICEYLKIDSASLQEKKRNPSPSSIEFTLMSGPDVMPTKKVCIVGTVEGGPDREWTELGYPIGYGEEYVDAASNDKNAYALLVSGNSMSPRMRPGEAILVEPNREAQVGDEVVVKLKERATMVKILSSVRGGKFTFDSISDSHERMVINQSDIEFIHYVAGVFRAGSIKSR